MKNKAMSHYNWHMSFLFLYIAARVAAISIRHKEGQQTRQKKKRKENKNDGGIKQEV